MRPIQLCGLIEAESQVTSSAVLLCLSCSKYQVLLVCSQTDLLVVSGVRMNLLGLQPALRTLTCDYNSLKKQVQEFPFMLETAITEAKQEVREKNTEEHSCCRQTQPHLLTLHPTLSMVL